MGGAHGGPPHLFFLTCRGRLAPPAREGRMAPKAPRGVAVRTATLVPWDPPGRRYVAQGARHFLRRMAVLMAAGAGWGRGQAEPRARTWALRFPTRAPSIGFT